MTALTPLSNFYIAFKVFYHTERQSDETFSRSLEKLPRSSGLSRGTLIPTTEIPGILYTEWT